MNRKTFLASLLTLHYAIKAALDKKKEDLVVSAGKSGGDPKPIKWKFKNGETISLIKEGDGQFYTLKWNIVDSIYMPDWVKAISIHRTKTH